MRLQATSRIVQNVSKNGPPWSESGIRWQPIPLGTHTVLCALFGWSRISVFSLRLCFAAEL